jgi:hypothetical protein
MKWKEIKVDGLKPSEAGVLLVLIFWGMGVCIVDGIKMITLKIGRLVL